MSVSLPDNGRRFVIQLKECVQRLAQQVQENPTTTLNEQNADTQRFCEALEVIFLHGIKIKEFSGAIPLWAFLERLENLQPPCIPLRNTIGAVASMPSFRTPIAKARAWIRQILNAGHLDESAMFMMAQSQLLRSYYNPGAILLNSEEGMGLVAVLRSAKALKFNFNLENDESLQTAPAWMLQAIQQALQPNLSTPARQGAPQVQQSNGAGSSNGSTNGHQQPAPTTNGTTTSASGTGTGNLSSTFGSFLRSFETSLDSMLVKVDAVTKAANKFIDEQLEPTDSAASTPTRAAAPLFSAFAATPGATKSVISASGARMVPFFGTPLKDLLLDERRSSHAFLNPLLGVPNQALRMINFIAARANTPDLFRRPVTLAVLTALKRDIEEEKEIPPTTDVAAVALLLMQWLNQLPEPLLGYEHYDAILACNEVEDTEHRVRNLALLVQEASWYCKPLLLRVVALLFKCIQPEHAAQNNLNIIAVSVLSTPCMFRPYVAALHLTPHTYFHDNEGRERLHMTATAAGSTTVEFIITHNMRILQRLREEQSMREAALAAKCARIVSLQERVSECVETVYVDYIDEGTQHTIRVLFEHLALAERLIAPAASDLSPLHTAPNTAANTTSNSAHNSTHTTPHQSAHTSHNDLFSITDHDTDHAQDSLPLVPEVPIGDILTHERWGKCGFLPSDVPLKDFNAPYGGLALQCLAGFMKRYHKQGAVMVQEYVQQRQRVCTLSHVSLQLTHFVLEVLRLLPSDTSSNTPSNSGASTTSLQGSGGSGKGGVTWNGAGVGGGARSATPIQVLAKQASWVLLTEEAAFQELFDLSMLTFEDTFKALSAPLQLSQQGSASSSIGAVDANGSTNGKLPGAAQCLSQCFSKTFGILHEIIHKRRPRSVQGMWEVWLGLRLAEQERQANIQLSAYSHNSSGNGGGRGNTPPTLSVTPPASSGSGTGNSGGTSNTSSSSPKGLTSAVVADAAEVFSSVMSVLASHVTPSGTSAGTNGVSAGTSTSGNGATRSPAAINSSGAAGANGKTSPFTIPASTTPATATTATTTITSTTTGTLPVPPTTPTTAPAPAPAHAVTNTSTSSALMEGLDDDDLDLLNLDAAWLQPATSTTSSPKHVLTGTAASASSGATASASAISASISASLDKDFDEAEWEAALDFIENIGGSAGGGSKAAGASSTSTAAPPTTNAHTVPAAATTATTTHPTPAIQATSTAQSAHTARLDGSVLKSVSGVVSTVRGSSHILTPDMIQQLEESLPTTYQCYDWDLVYRLSNDGANVNTLVHKAKAHSSTLLVVQDAQGAVFGALITEHLKMGEKEKYYGNGTIAVWSFVSGKLQYYPWSFKNSYFLITSKDSLALGGGGHFAIYLDGELNRGSSGPCATFSSPCLASQEEFSCQSCELFALSTSLLGL